MSTTRIPSGTVDQGFYFVAVDALDFTTRKTGLATWTIFRSRNGAAEAAWTTPTVTEIDAVNFPGIYFLLCDEDMTVAAGNETEEMCIAITHAGMAPVVKVIELFDTAGWLVETGWNLRQVMRIVAAALAGEASGMGTATGVFRDIADAKTRITATQDADGNRSALTLDAT